MNTNAKQKGFAAWFPGKTATRDRWGNAVGSELQGREFHGANTGPGATERLRWSLGHA